ncbi:hypothetical protein, partial [Streptomyces otsuchiensis]|uniref:hypothetical protein n=1 Tax=Streptomyces otsuchiensis TaxID=2681388 RepID=UPI001D131EE9
PPTVRTYHPEPDSQRLAEYVTLTALGPVPDAHERVTRWVRALRHLHGADIDTNPGRAAEFRPLLHGLAATERLRLAADSTAPPLTWDVLVQETRTWLENQTGVAHRAAIDPAEIRTMLLRNDMDEARTHGLASGVPHRSAAPHPIQTDSDGDSPMADSPSEPGWEPVDPGLYQPESHEAIAEIGRMSSDERAVYASDPARVAALRARLTVPQFSEAAAALMLHLAPGVERPAAARHVARRRLADILRGNHGLADLMLRAKVRFVVMARSQSLRATAPVHRQLRTEKTDGVDWDAVRGVTNNRTVMVGEENLVGERSYFQQYQPGQSVLAHETAHAIHNILRDYQGPEKLYTTGMRVIQSAFDAAMAKENARTARIEQKVAAFRGAPDEIARTRAVIAAHRGEGAAWPNGEFRTFSENGQWSTENYSARNVKEFFAELSMAWLGTNHGNDGYTTEPRNNGSDWVRANYRPAMVKLLTFLYGHRVEPARDDGGNVVPGSLDIPDDNPMPSVRADNARFEQAGQFWARIEANERWLAQLTDVFGPGLRSDQARLADYRELFTAGERLRAADPAHGPRPADLDSLVREVLQRHSGDLTPAHVTEALESIRDGRTDSVKTLTEVAAVRLHSMDVLAGTELRAADGSAQGRSLSRPPTALRLDETAALRADGTVERRPAPWRQPPEAVDVMSTAEGRYRVRTEEVSLAVLVELVAGDPERDSGMPAAFVLTRPDPGQRLAIALAKATDVRVWSSDGLDYRPSAGDPSRSALTLARGAQWVPTDPPSSAVAAQGSLTLVNNTVFADSRFLSRPLLSNDGQHQVGRNLAPNQRVPAAMITQWTTAVTHHLQSTRGTTGTPPPFVLIGDGANAQPMLHVRGDQRPWPATPAQTVELLGRTQILRDLPNHSGILLLWPELGHLTSPDPLTSPLPAQLLANATSSIVFVPQPSAPGRPPTPVEVRPEPNSLRIAAIKTLTALGPVQRADERVLRWVRASRQLFGRDIDTNPARNDEFEKRMHGFAALERSRLSVSPTAPPLSAADFHARVTSHRATMASGTTPVAAAIALLDGLADHEFGVHRTMNAMDAGPSTQPAAPARRRAKPRDPRLYQPESHEAIAEIGRLSSDERAVYAGDSARVAALRAQLTPPQFSEAAAALMLHLAPGVERPAAARHAARRRLADILRDNHDVIDMLLGRGTRFLVMARGISLNDTAPGHLSRRRNQVASDIPWSSIRGATTQTTVILGEENLLGERSYFQEAPEGFSLLTHEAGHAVHNALLSYRGTDEQLATAGKVIQETYDAFRAIEKERRDRIEAAIDAVRGAPDEYARTDKIIEAERGTGAPWPNGEYRRFNTDGTWSEVNYSASNVHEFFAELTGAWIGTNHGVDPFARGERRNGARWAAEAMPEPMVALLKRLYGDRTTADTGSAATDGTTPPLFPTPPGDNPLAATAAENEGLDAFRSLWEQMDGSQQWGFPLAEVYGRELTRDRTRFAELMGLFQLGEQLRAADPAR